MSSLKIAILLVILTNFLSAQDINDELIFSSKCRTFDSKFRNQLRTEKSKPKDKAQVPNVVYRVDMQKLFPSPSGRFLIHYDTTGINAVPKIDNNKNGISDFVDSVAYYFDYVYHIEVEEMGFYSPLPDSGLDGSDAYDIYLMQLGIGDEMSGPGYYGYTVPDKDINPQRNYPRYTSYITIDNDYSSLDSSVNSSGKKYRTYTDTSYLGLKITAAHEFHHAIQFKYGEDMAASSLHELTSTWMEYRVFPETKDFLQYVKVLFRDPTRYNFGSGSAERGYMYSIFGQYLYSKYQDRIIKEMWEGVYSGYGAFKSLDSSLVYHQSSLAEAWCEFLPWLYYTGTRAQKDKYFEKASFFPEVTFNKQSDITPPSVIYTGNLYSFEFRFYRVIFPSKDFTTVTDPFDFGLVNTDTQSAILSGDRSFPHTLMISKDISTGSFPIGESGYYYRLDCDNNFYCSKPLNLGIGSKNICYTFPDPFIYGKDDLIYFPATIDKAITEKVELKIYSSDLVLLFDETLPVIIREDKRVVAVNPELINLATGVHIFNVSSDKSECFGKFTIIK